MNLLTFPHTLITLFQLSFKLFQKNIYAMMIVTLVVLSPALLIGLFNFTQLESIIFFISMRILESSMTLGVIILAFGNIFSSTIIIQKLGSSLILGAAHVAILQYLLFVIGIMGLTIMPFPINIIIIMLWISGIFYFSLAQPIYVVENKKGIQAMIRSFQLVKKSFLKVFSVTALSMLLQFLIFAIFFRLFIPDLNIDTTVEPEDLQMQLNNIMQDTGVHKAIRISQYFTAFLFFPFASIITALLYFDLIRKEGNLKTEYLKKISEKLFGISNENSN